MAHFTNAIPAADSDLQGVLYDVMETTGLPYDDGSGVSGAVQIGRMVRIGGLNAQSTNVAAFWQPDGLGGVAGAYPIAQQVVTGNARFSPSAETGRAYRHFGLKIPVGYNPALETGGLALLPFAYQAEVSVYLRKATAGAGINQFFVGWENPNASSMFLNAQGSLGFGLISPDGTSTFAQYYRRVDATAGAPGGNVALASPIDVVSAPVLVTLRVTWGQTWVAEIEVNGATVVSLTPATLGWANLNQCNATSQLFAYPVIYSGGSRIAGPFYSRATVRLVAP